MSGAGRYSVLAAALVVCGLLGACIGGSMQAPRYYTLRPPAEATQAESAPRGSDGWRLGVDSISVDPPYDQDRLVYRTGPDSPEVGFYHYHRWASPLGRLLQVALVDGLSETEGLQTIEPVRSGREYHGRLGGRLLVLEEVDSPEGQEVRLVLVLALRDAEGDPVWEETLSASVGARAAGVPEVAELAQRAVDQVLRQAAEGVGAALASRTAGLNPE